LSTLRYTNGILIANLMPFTAALECDWDQLRDLTRRLKAIDGINGFVVNAYAGEGPTLTREERIRAIELHRAECNRDQPVIAAILDISTAGAVTQARDAELAGADALLLCPPIASSWQAHASPQVALEYHRAIIEAVSLPIVLFQLAVGDPSSYSHALLMQMVQEFSQVFAVKMAQAADIVRYDQDWLALQSCGRCIFAWPAVGSSMFHCCTTGADGILTGLATFAPHEIVAMFRALRRGELHPARELHRRLAPMNHRIYGHPYVDLHCRYKELAFQAGVISTPYVRGPMIRVNERERVALQATLDAAALRPIG